MEEMGQDLPLSWSAPTFKEVSEYIQRGKSPKYVEKSDLPVINQKCVRWNGVDTEHVKYVHPDQFHQWSNERFLQNKDILWNSTGTGTIGRACLYRSVFEKTVVDSHVTIVRTHKNYILPEYVFYFISSSFVQKKIEDMQSGSTNQVELGKVAIEQTTLPLAPLNEQKRIVDRIELLFSDLDKGEALLKTVQRQLATYRQSILKAAVTGELTKDWREQNKHRLESGEKLLARILESRRKNWQGRGKYQEPSVADKSALLKLPDGWTWAKMEQMAYIMGGLTKNQKRHQCSLKRPMLRVANVYQNRLKLEDIHEIGINESELERVSLENNDILIVEGNGSKDQIGRMAIWQNQIENCIHQNHLIKARMIDTGLAKHVLTWFMSPMGREIIEKAASSTSGLHTLSISRIGELVIPLPSIDEASEIASQIEETFSQIDALEMWCMKELTRSDTLRRSILKSAFSGKLVAQEPKDEPASELLKRIQSGKATAITPRGRKTRSDKSEAA